MSVNNEADLPVAHACARNISANRNQRVRIPRQGREFVKLRVLTVVLRVCLSVLTFGLFGELNDSARLPDLQLNLEPGLRTHRDVTLLFEGGKPRSLYADVVFSRKKVCYGKIARAGAQRGALRAGT